MLDNKKVKIKQNTLWNDYKEGGLKNVDIELKIASLKCSWVKQLYTLKFSRVENYSFAIYK